MKKWLRFVLALAAALAAAAPAAAALPRRAMLGIQMAPDRQTGNGVTVTGLVPGGTAEALGLRTGDIVVRAGDAAVAHPPELAAYAVTLHGGDPVALTVRRGGRQLVLRGPAVARPLESFAGAHVDYGEVDFGGGELRDILVTPDNVTAPPIVYLIQGFACATMELPSYHRLGEELVRRGIGFYRVEKPGMGDSAGGAPCATIDYATELDAFRTAYRHLTTARGVDADRVFMLGHSLGGLEVPMLAAERPPRGVAVYGTVLRNWADYYRDLIQFQPYLFEGTDLATQSALADQMREALRRFFFLRDDPATIAAADPAYAAGLREYFGWDGGRNMFGRSFKYMQDLAHQPVIAAWRDARTNVLALYGESDMVALFDTDHKLVADMANFVRPGTGRYVEIPRTGHGMDVIGTRQEVRARTRADGTVPQGEFNPAVADALAAWIRDAMASPPVRERFPAAAAS
jgi:pimeloyl-ACP methyl ester carboxylesterase